MESGVAARPDRAEKIDGAVEAEGATKDGGMGPSAWARAAARQSQPKVSPSRRGFWLAPFMRLSSLKNAIGFRAAAKTDQDHGSASLYIGRKSLPVYPFHMGFVVWFASKDKRNTNKFRAVLSQ